MEQTQPQTEYGFHNRCISCGKSFKIIRKNVIRCDCTTKFWNITKIIAEYEEKYLNSKERH